MLKFCLPLCLLLTAFSLFAQPKIKLVDYANGFTRPVDIAYAPGDNRLFIVEQRGYIWILDDAGNRLPDTFLNIDARVNSTGNEQGLLGLAFDPNYAQNGYFYVNYIKNDGNTRIARFSVTANPNVADPNSEAILLEQAQPYPNHNGGCLKFGPDGYLYAGLGDGGSGGDPQGNAQNPATYLGKILRLDVHSDSLGNYGIPPDNPFIGNTSFKPEIWSYGWRNPWRFSFDRATGDLWVADVGQGTWEEIDYEPAGSAGGNYGWRCYEGTHAYSTGGCQPQSAYLSPIFEYQHSTANGCSVTGGFVYRGGEYADLQGLYVFVDYCSGRWWYIRHNPDETFTATILADLSTFQYSSLGEDVHGNLYVASLSGKIQKVTELCSSFQVSGVADSAVCDQSFSGTIFLDVQGGQAPYSFAWSNGKTDQNIVYLNPDTYMLVASDANGCERRDTFVIENLSPPAPVLLSPDTVWLCPDQAPSFQLAASGAPDGYGYQWFRNGDYIPSAQDSVYQGTQPGTYQARLSGICSTALSAPVEVTMVTVPGGLPQPYVSGDTIFAPNLPGFQVGYQWLFGADTLVGATDSFYIATQSGDYRVDMAFLLNGCLIPVSDSIHVELSGTSLPAGVQHFSLMPNPTTGNMLLLLDLKHNGHTTLSLADAAQRQIFLQTHQEQHLSVPLDLHMLPAGNYFLTVQTEEGSFVRKVVKQ